MTCPHVDHMESCRDVGCEYVDANFRDIAPCCQPVKLTTWSNAAKIDVEIFAPDIAT